MFKRKHLEPQSEELDLTALLNILVVLVSFLLLSAVFSKITIQEINMPPLASSPEEASKNAPPVVIEVMLRKDGLEIGDGTNVTTRLPKEGGRYDTAMLSQKLKLLKDENPGKRDVILLVGGLFLMYKATTEIHEKLEGQEHAAAAGSGVSFASVITQILILDIVFSLDSVITAVGMVQTSPENRSVGLTIMIIAVVVAVGVMLFAAKPISDFVNRHPTVKMLAFSFLILVGVVLVVDASHRHIPKGYIYFAMAFSIGVEMLNLRLRKKGTPVHLHDTPEPTTHVASMEPPPS